MSSFNEREKYILEIQIVRTRDRLVRNTWLTQDMRGRIGHHRYSFEVECDIREFIENYPSRKSHYCNSVRTGRKYLGPDKNITSIHKEFWLHFSMWSIIRYAYISNLIYIGSTLGVVQSCPALFSNFFSNFTTRVLFRFIPFYSIPLHSIPLNSVLFYSIAFHCIPMHSIAFHGASAWGTFG